MPLRVASVIVLLYAQPLTRVVRLTVDDVLRTGDAVLLRLGEPASPVVADALGYHGQPVVGGRRSPRTAGQTVDFLVLGNAAGDDFEHQAPTARTTARLISPRRLITRPAASAGPPICPEGFMFGCPSQHPHSLRSSLCSGTPRATISSGRPPAAEPHTPKPTGPVSPVPHDVTRTSGEHPAGEPASRRQHHVRHGPHRRGTRLRARPGCPGHHSPGRGHRKGSDVPAG